MPSTFDAIFAAALPELIGQFGQAVVYQDSVIEATDLIAIAEEEKAEDAIDGPGRTQRRTRLVTIARDTTADSGGVADPKTNGQITIGDRIYEIEAIERMDDNAATLRCVYVGRLPSSNRQIGR